MRLEYARYVLQEKDIVREKRLLVCFVAELGSEGLRVNVYFLRRINKQFQSLYGISVICNHFESKQDRLRLVCVLVGLYITALKDTFSRKSCRTCNRSTVEQADKYYCSMSIIFSLLKGEVQLCNLFVLI
jgi:peptide subunit release factor 1 (eRF1)